MGSLLDKESLAHPAMGGGGIVLAVSLSFFSAAEFSMMYKLSTGLGSRVVLSSEALP
jgi:hypothetical protein